MASTTRAPELTDRELSAWRGLLRTHALLVKRLEADLEALHGLALTPFEVLSVLEEAEGRRMRMCDIASAVQLSRSGLTRLVDRLERDGLVERESCPSDARGAFARLTGRGRSRLAEARPTHSTVVRSHFCDQLEPDELEALAAACERVQAALGQADPCP